MSLFIISFLHNSIGLGVILLHLFIYFFCSSIMYILCCIYVIFGCVDDVGTVLRVCATVLAMVTVVAISNDTRVDALLRKMKKIQDKIKPQS